MRSVIHWECQADQHRALHSRRGQGGLTIHDGMWAYCDGEGGDDAHRWVATGGVPLESLVRWSTGPARISGHGPNGEGLLNTTAMRASAARATDTTPMGTPPKRTTGVRRT